VSSFWLRFKEGSPTHHVLPWVIAYCPVTVTSLISSPTTLPTAHSSEWSLPDREVEAGRIVFLFSPGTTPLQKTERCGYGSSQ